MFRKKIEITLENNAELSWGNMTDYVYVYRYGEKYVSPQNPYREDFMAFDNLRPHNSNPRGTSTYAAPTLLESLFWSKWGRVKDKFIILRYLLKTDDTFLYNVNEYDRSHKSYYLMRDQSQLAIQKYWDTKMNMRDYMDRYRENSDAFGIDRWEILMQPREIVKIEQAKIQNGYMLGKFKKA